MEPAIEEQANQNEPRREIGADRRPVERKFNGQNPGTARVANALVWHSLGCRRTNRAALHGTLPDQTGDYGQISEAFISYPLAGRPTHGQLVKSGCFLHFYRPGGVEFVASGKRMCHQWHTRRQGGQCLCAGVGNFFYFPDVSRR